MDPDRSTLRCITDMFVEMLRNAEGGVLDLKDAVQALPPGQKRRIYDVTNVLEGVGLIVTLSSGKIKWREAAFEKDLLRQMDLQVELEALEELEAMLDNQMLLVENIIRNAKQDCSSLAYMSLKELCDCYPDDSVLTVQAPSGIQLDVAIPKAVANTPPVFQIHLKSVNGPINVLLLSKSLSVPPCPVVLSFPPSKELLERARLASKAEELE
ncbi:transcription factor E2F4-like [Synchiropus splendidus]|uniref:transcription factor E2F4-like n=1 Tax=Synchiropus splendidus TaxID=270530 RepID=UPI00237E7968|nr:transcription factor E2F4-like [Synchiropus splendidus]